MNGTSTISNWYYLALVALSAYAIGQIFVLPFLRRVIYRRTSRTMQKLSDKLDFGLPVYAMAKRSLWVDRLMNDHEVQKAIAEENDKGREGLEQSQSSDINQDAQQSARVFAKEIVPSFNTIFYFKAGYWIARRFLRAFYWIGVGQSAQGKYKQIGKDCCVVLVSNHRSNFDPLLMIYLTSQVAPVSYSAGEWALGTPFRQVLQALGFYVIRRDQTGNALYQKILERFVFLATSHCITQGVFIEGGLSRDGHLQKLKLGLVSYICRSLDSDTCKDIVFIPCALNYDKIPEDRTLIMHKELGFESKGRFYSLLSFLKFFATVISYAVPRRHKPFGYSCVNFGEPVSLIQWQQEHGVEINQLDKAERRQSISALGGMLADKVSELLPILPSNLLVRVLVNNEQLPMTELKLKVESLKLADSLTENGVKVYIPSNDGDYAFSQGIYVLLRRKLIEPTGDGRFALVPGQQDLVNYYINTIDSAMSKKLVS